VKFKRKNKSQFGVFAAGRIFLYPCLGSVISPSSEKLENHPDCKPRNNRKKSEFSIDTWRQLTLDPSNSGMSVSSVNWRKKIVIFKYSRSFWETFLPTKIWSFEIFRSNFIIDQKKLPYFLIFFKVLKSFLDYFDEK
jgi:hypothetical protein